MLLVSMISMNIYMHVCEGLLAHMDSLHAHGGQFGGLSFVLVLV